MSPCCERGSALSASTLWSRVRTAPAQTKRIPSDCTLRLNHWCLTTVLVARRIGSPRWRDQVDLVGYSVRCAQQRSADCWKKARPNLAVRRPKWLPSAFLVLNDRANNPGTARSAEGARRKGLLCVQHALVQHFPARPLIHHIACYSSGFALLEPGGLAGRQQDRRQRPLMERDPFGMRGEPHQMGQLHETACRVVPPHSPPGAGKRADTFQTEQTDVRSWRQARPCLPPPEDSGRHTDAYSIHLGNVQRARRGRSSGHVQAGDAVLLLSVGLCARLARYRSIHSLLDH